MSLTADLLDKVFANGQLNLDTDFDCEIEIRCNPIKTNIRRYVREMIQSWERKNLSPVPGSCKAVTLFQN